MIILEQLIDLKLKELYSEEQMDGFYLDFKASFSNYEKDNQEVVQILLEFIDFQKFKVFMLNFKHS